MDGKEKGSSPSFGTHFITQDGHLQIENDLLIA